MKKSLPGLGSLKLFVKLFQNLVPLRKIFDLFFSTFFILFFFISNPLYALEPVVVTSSNHKYEISPNLEFFEDTSGLFQFADIESLVNKWEKSKRVVPNFGFSDSVFWFRFSLRNTSEKAVMKYLEIAFPLLDHVELYVPKGEQGYKVYKTGARASIESRDVIDRNFVFHIAVPTGQNEYYIRIKTTGSVEIPLILWSESGFIKRCNWQLPLLWIYFGMLIIIMVYYFCLFMTEDEKSHFYCSFFILSIGFCNFYLTGLGYQYIFHQSSWLNDRGGYYFVYSAIVSGVLYARSNIKQSKLFGKYICRSILWFWFLLIVIGTITGFGKNIHIVFYLSGFISLSILLVSIFYFSFNTFNPDYIVLFGTITYVIGVLLFLLKGIGLLPSNFITGYGHIAGSAVMILFFAQGLYENILRRQKKLVELSQSRKELERIINQSTATALLLRVDKYMSVEFVSDNIEEFGYLPEDLLSGRNNFIDMIHPKDREIFLEALEHNLEDGLRKSFSLEYRILSREGEVFWVDNRNWFRRKENGVVTHIQAVIMNVSDRKKLELELNHFHEIDRVLSLVTSNFISFHPEEISAGFEEALELIAEFTGAHSGQIFLFSKDGHYIKNTHEWCANKIKSRIGVLKKIEVAKLPAVVQLLKEEKIEEKVIELSCADKTSDELSKLKKFFLMETMESEILVPLISGNKVLGFLAFTVEDRWNHKYTPLLKNIAQVLSNVFVRIYHDDDIKEYQAELRLLSSELILAEERQRRKIAIELHDSIGHALANCRIKLGRLQSEVGKGFDLTLVDEIRELIEQSIEDTQTLTFSISPHILYDLGLEAAVDWLAEQTENEHGISFEFIDDMSFKPLSLTSRVLLYQIVRELVFNLVKHSKASKSRISIGSRDGNIVIDIQDNGVGFKTSGTFSGKAKKRDYSGKKFGLFSVRERLRNENGALTIVSEENKGTNLSIIYPLDKI